MVTLKRSHIVYMAVLLAVLMIFPSMFTEQSLAADYWAVVHTVDPEEGDSYAEILINNKPVITLYSISEKFEYETIANKTAKRLNHLFEDHTQTVAVFPDLKEGEVVLREEDQVIITVDEKLAAYKGKTTSELALKWLDNLEKILARDLVGERIPTKSGIGQERRGIASWYGGVFHGRVTASGEVYDKYELTAAHRRLPFGTVLMVTDTESDKSVLVRVNDRGPFHSQRFLDLSKKAALDIGMISSGTANVVTRVISMPANDE